MSRTFLLKAIPVFLVAFALLLLVLSVMMRQRRLAFLAAGFILVNANWSSVNGITRGLGVGAAPLLTGVVFVLLTVCFGLEFSRLPRPLLRGPGILLVLTLYYIAVFSPLVSIDLAASMRASLSFVLVCSLGWCVFGKIFSQHPDLARARVYQLVYVNALNSLIILIATAVLLGPAARRLAIGGVESRIGIGTLSVSRLQAEGFNATGLGMLAAGALFTIIHWYAKSGQDAMKRGLLLGLATIAGVLLLWTGGRSAIFAFLGAAFVIAILASVQNRMRAFRNLVFLVAAFLCLYMLRDIFVGVFWRGNLNAKTTKSIVELFLETRIEQSISALELYGRSVFFGSGAGILTQSVFNVESYFFRVLIELGIVGGAIYTLTFLWMTYYVLRVDLHYLRLRRPGAWLPSSVFLFAWIISPVSYGFSLFTGGLVVQLAIAAGAAVEWKRIREMRSS